MIVQRIGINLNFSRDKLKLVSLGSVFGLSNDLQLLVSVQPNLYIVRGMDGGRIIKVCRDDERSFLYDWIERTEVSGSDSIDDEEADAQQYVVERISSTERVVRLGNQKARISGDVGRYLFSVGSYLLFKKNGKEGAEVRCFDFSSGKMVWKCAVEGDAYSVNGVIVFLRAYHNEKRTVLSIVDLIEGSVIVQRQVDGVAVVGMVGNDTLCGSLLVDGNWYVFKYKPTADNLDCSPCPNPQLRKITGIEFVGEQYYIYYNNVSSESMSDGENQVYIDRYSLDGVPEGGVRVRGVEVKVPINRIGEKYFARSVSRGNVYTQREYILSWSEQDFLNETNENHIEKLNSICNKNIGPDGKNYYTVSLAEEHESFFQLFRQMSMGVYELIMTTAREYDHESCKFDQNFDGTVYCDVTNHKLDKRERVSIENMCQHLEHEFADYASFDREMWKIPVKVIPLFAE